MSKEERKRKRKKRKERRDWEKEYREPRRGDWGVFNRPPPNTDPPTRRERTQNK